MKRLKKLNIKLGILCFIPISIFAVWVFTQGTDTASKLCYTVFYIPFLLFLMQNVIQKKQENDYFNIDLYMKKNVENSVIWKSRTDKSQEDIVYLCIKNTGKVDIFSMYIKVIKIDGEVGCFEVREMLNVNKECIICIPYIITNVKEIVVTCSIQMENKIKKFNGIQSGNDNMIIFSNSELFDTEKNAIYHENRFKVFEKLERFIV